MSRIGKEPVAIPAGVEVKVSNNEITVKGAMGTLTRTLHANMKVEVKDNAVVVTRPNDDKENRALHGLTRTLIANMVKGVSEGFAKELEVNGVGYRVQKQGNKLIMNMGFSHPVEFEDRGETKIEAPSQTSIIVTGPDKEAVGQLAAEIRKVRPPEPYKGKGIKYAGERIIRKEGKMGKK